MSYFFKLAFIVFFIFLSSCKNNNEQVSIIEEKSLDLQMIDAYNEGLELLDQKYALKAAKKFSEAELLYPQSEWAPKSSLMSAYSYYYASYYFNAIDELKRFIEIYPKHERLVYAYYLLAMCYYEQITDERKDLGSIIDAQKNFNIVLEKYPNSDFAIDSEFKLELILEILASKEMYLARYYIEKEKWIPAINRYKNVLKNYDTTIYVEEALHRLVEIHYSLGLKEESEKYAKLLGYNYQSSQWYEMTYSVFNEMYKKQNLDKKEKSFVQKVKSLFNWDE